jgi:ABC-type multidrug transport system permease subunit
LQVVTLDDTAAVTALRIGTVALVVVAVDSQQVEYRFDRARTEARTARLLVDQALQRKRGRVDAVTVRESLISERGSRYIDFVLPGLLAMNLMGSGMWGIGFSIVDARRKKLLKRFVATPMRRHHYLASFLLMRLGLMVIEVTVIATFGYFAFGVPMRGSLVAFGVACLLGALVFGSLGLLVASRAKTVEAASGLMNLLMLPMWVASGVFFSAGNFPDAVQPVIQALPLTAVVDAVRGIMIQGMGWSGLAPEFAIITTWLVLSFGIALKFFRWR